MLKTSANQVLGIGSSSWYRIPDTSAHFSARYRYLKLRVSYTRYRYQPLRQISLPNLHRDITKRWFQTYKEDICENQCRTFFETIKIFWCDSTRYNCLGINRFFLLPGITRINVPIRLKMISNFRFTRVSQKFNW